MNELPDDVRRRLAEIFGDDAPSSADERGDGGSASERDTDSGADPERSDRWLRENRPPHHG